MVRLNLFDTLSFALSLSFYFPRPDFLSLALFLPFSFSDTHSLTLKHSLSPGGNKVRTLEHQLAIVEARANGTGKPPREIIVLGTGGSNQVLLAYVCPQAL